VEILGFEGNGGFGGVFINWSLILEFYTNFASLNN
jgi:hypothetical protein